MLAYVVTAASSFLAGLIVMGLFSQSIIKDYEKAADALSYEFKRVAGAVALVRKAL